jgi:4-hydroxythreonine-4-phosphate dehydrogenase
MTHPLPLLLTMGEPAGIGPELALKAWSDRKLARLAPFAVVGDPDHLTRVALDIGLDVPLDQVELSDITDAFTKALPVIPVVLAEQVRYGFPDIGNSPVVIRAIETAVDLVHKNRARGIVTCPIQKSVLADAGFAHPGHTEFLAALATDWPENAGLTCQPVMMLASGTLRVIPATVHVPLSQVANDLTTELLIETGRIVAHDLENRFGISNPRLWFCGVNPHAGEAGQFGTEERDIITPAIAALKNDGILAEGPFAADSMFHATAREKYDAAIAMYHDQALIPIKTLAFDEAVNVTLGLPFVRTSPDHGTALDIAGTGKASCTSLIAAIHMADKMSLPSTPTQ